MQTGTHTVPEPAPAAHDAPLSTPLATAGGALAHVCVTGSVEMHVLLVRENTSPRSPQKSELLSETALVVVDVVSEPITLGSTHWHVEEAVIFVAATVVRFCRACSPIVAMRLDSCWVLVLTVVCTVAGVRHAVGLDEQ